MVTISNVRQWHNGNGFITTGLLTLEDDYATGGDAVDIPGAISTFVGGGTAAIDQVIIGLSGTTTAFYDKANEKLRVFKINTGVFTELANEAAYDANTELPFVAFSR